MLKLTCGLDRHVQDPASGSRGASVSVEVTLDRVTLRDPARLTQHIRCGFDRIRAAIEEELARPGPAAATPDPGQRRHRQRANGRDRLASASRLRLLRVLAGRQDIELVDLLRERFDKEDAAERLLSEAGALIDELNDHETTNEGR